MLLKGNYMRELLDFLDKNQPDRWAIEFVEDGIVGVDYYYFEDKKEDYAEIKHFFGPVQKVFSEIKGFMDEQSREMEP